MSKRRVFAAALVLCLLPAVPVRAAESGVTVMVQDGYSCDYGVDVPFTRSARTGSYTFALYPGEAVSGAPEVTAAVEITAAKQVNVHLPLRYDLAGPSTWTLQVTAHVAPGREAFDREASATSTFTTAPTCGCPAGTAGAYYAGNGSEKSPFWVATPGQLQHVGVHSASCLYQERDINLTGTWTPLPTFTGIYDGGGHKITGLKVLGSSDDLSPKGLFSHILGGSITSLWIENATVSGANASGTFAGSMNNGSISFCHATAHINDVDGYQWPSLGGIVGSMTSSQLENCYFAGVLQSDKGSSGSRNTRWVGGISGIMYNYCTVRNCYSYVEYQVTDDAFYVHVPLSVGGIAGDASQSLGNDQFLPGGVNSFYNYWVASGSGIPQNGIANLSNSPAGPSANNGCSKLSSFSSLPGGFDSEIWEMGTVQLPTLSGSVQTVNAPVLKIFTQKHP
ncbi:hypothetical protein [Harryflintia acetispora]|uniref:hypothetical protein n=1 Tax=Harryflintia acetispora TaxID=1849041 RepID=UPI00189A7140|nr:hypothetical protein [Harryflintia acetispora]